LAAFLKPAAVVRPAALKSVSFMTLIRHWGGPGLFALAILDGLPIPTFGGPDILTAILAARHREPWYYYAAMTAAGSVIGAYITFRAARHAGASYLQKWFGERRVSRFLELFNRWGTGGLLLSTAVPIPFPTSAFFAAAGVVDYPRRRFIGIVAAGRAMRYAAIAAFASLYGRQFIRVLRHPRQYIGWFVLIVGVVGALVFVTLWMKKQMAAGEQSGVAEQS
jgi:membrane protein YqaA with SNARE-associated domain